MTRSRCCVLLMAIFGGCDSQPPDMPLVAIDENSISVFSLGNDALWGVKDVVHLNGTIWALTTAAPYVHGFEPTGGFSARFGVKGEGPGELRFPSSMWPGPQPGSVTVWDPGSRAALTFSSRGRLLSASQTPTPGVIRSDIATVTFGHPFRAFKVPRAMVVARYTSSVSHGSDLWNGRLVLVSNDGEELATIIHFAHELPGAAHRSTAPMLAPVPLWDGCPDGRIAVLDPVARLLLILSSSGQRLDVIPLPWEPKPLDQETRLAYLISRIRAEVGDRDIAEAEIVEHATETAGRADDLFGVHEPLAVDLRCSPSKVWIQEFDADSHPLGFGPVWRTVALGHRPAVFSRVLFPPEFSPYRISDSLAIGVVADSVGFQRLAAVTLPSTLDPEPLPVHSSGNSTFTQDQGDSQP